VAPRSSNDKIRSKRKKNAKKNQGVRGKSRGGKEEKADVKISPKEKESGKRSRHKMYKTTVGTIIWEAPKEDRDGLGKGLNTPLGSTGKMSCADTRGEIK